MHKSLAITSTVVVVLSLFAGCSGDDDREASDPSSTALGSVDGESDATTDDTGPADDLSELLARQEDAVIKVTYRRGESVFTIAQDHDRKAITSGGTKVIIDDDTTVNCTDIDTTPECLETPEGVNSLVNVGLSFYNVVAQGLASAAEELPGLATTQEQVAGRRATCAEGDSRSFLAGLADDLEGLELPSLRARICIDNASGFLLEFSTSEDASDNLVATEVTTPTDADFEPPAPVEPIVDDPDATIAD
jgi:hypothetical protein